MDARDNSKVPVIVSIVSAFAQPSLLHVPNSVSTMRPGNSERRGLSRGRGR